MLYETYKVVNAAHACIDATEHARSVCAITCSVATATAAVIFCFFFVAIAIVCSAGAHRSLSSATAMSMSCWIHVDLIWRSSNFKRSVL